MTLPHVIRGNKHNNQPDNADKNGTELENCGGFNFTMGKMARGEPIRDATGGGANI